MNKTTKWEKQFAADMAKASVREEVKFDSYVHTTEYGHKFGLVFYGASDAISERASLYFYAWVCKNRSMMIKRGMDGAITVHGKVKFDLYERNAAGHCIPGTAKNTVGYATTYYYESSGD